MRERASGWPAMTAEQRAMAVALLANAIRKDEHLRVRSRGMPLSDVLPGLGSRRRAEASGEYVRGMRDLLAVLFEGGRAAADECYAAARTQALGDEAAS